MKYNVLVNRLGIVLAVMLFGCVRMDSYGTVRDGAVVDDVNTSDNVTANDGRASNDNSPQPDVSSQHDVSSQPDVSPQSDLASKLDMSLQSDISNHTDLPTQLDGPYTTPCAVGLTQGEAYVANLVVCVGTAGGTGISQCAAPALCNDAGGWSRGTASQFLARGGETVATVERAWIGACVRDNGTVTSPTNAICTSCTSGNVGGAVVGWKCNGSTSDTYTYTNPYIGVVSSPACHRVGVNAVHLKGYWRPAPVISAAVEAAVCCR